MADKLDWLNKHLVLIRHLTVKDAVEKESYKIRPDLEADFEGVANSETAVFKFARKKDYKSACELMAYIAHRRAAVWWGYRCVHSLMRELASNPAEERDIADIAANFEVEVPDWAKIELPKIDPNDEAAILNARAQASANLQAMKASIDPEILKFVEEAVEFAFQEFKKVHGIHPIDLLKKFGERLKEPTDIIDPNSPVFTEKAKLEAQLQAVQKETVDTIKSVLPPKSPEHEKKMRDSAMAAVYRWVAAPDAPNSKACFDIGNECPDTPAGLLALTAFWSFGDLMPGGDKVVATPPGLAANGLCQTLLLAALHKGGVRKVKERYEEYFMLGIDVLTGKNTWAHTLASGMVPHSTVLEPSPPAGPARPPENNEPPAGSAPKPGEYKRWKPPE